MHVCVALKKVVLSRPIHHHQGADDVFIHSVMYLEIFDGWGVIQAPAICNLFRGMDLQALSSKVNPKLILHIQFICELMFENFHFDQI